MRDILVRLSEAVGKEEGDWLGAIERAERWCKYTEYVLKQNWPLFPDVPEDQRTSGKLFQQVDELRRLWHTVARNAAGHVFAHGLLVDTEKIEDLQHWVDEAPRKFEKEVAALLSPQPSTREEILDKIPGLVSTKEGECSHPQELAARMHNEVTTTWEVSLRGIANLQSLAPTTEVSWSAILNHFASLVKPGRSEEKLKEDNAALQEKLDDALMRLELLKGTSGGGPQKYTVPLFNTHFTDECSWNTWRNQALAWAKENPMVLGTPANALSWFSRLLSGSAHDYVVSKIGEILEEMQTIHEAVQAVAGLLDLFFAYPDAETRAIESFWKTLPGNRRFGRFYMNWQAARAALPEHEPMLDEFDGKHHEKPRAKTNASANPVILQNGQEISECATTDCEAPARGNKQGLCHGCWPHAYEKRRSELLAPGAPWEKAAKEIREAAASDSKRKYTGPFEMRGKKVANPEQTSLKCVSYFTCADGTCPHDHSPSRDAGGNSERDKRNAKPRRRKGRQL